jgi:hypothetical protein
MQWRHKRIGWWIDYLKKNEYNIEEKEEKKNK